MSKEELHPIEELPDLRENIEEYYEYQGVPLLDYVCEVANHFLPNSQKEYMKESKAPAIFVNRYLESKLSVEERYQKHKEFYISNETLEDFLKRDHRKLDTSFKDKFLNNEEYDSEGNKNRMLSNLLRRYAKEEFPTVIGHYYMQ